MADESNIIVLGRHQAGRTKKISVGTRFFLSIKYSPKENMRKAVASAIGNGKYY